MRDRGFLADGEAIGAHALDSIKALREVLRDFAAANNHHPLTPAAVDALNDLAERNPMVVRASGEGPPELVPGARCESPAMARILAAFFSAASDGSWVRLKRCPGLGCPFTFYDASRNRTGTWCSMSVCGNRTKVRKYQQRRRGAPAG
jgi:predicted RNA-binding Zn ribbon-like protein